MLSPADSCGRILVRKHPSSSRLPLQDCIPSLSPASQEPKLSTYWIDHAISALSSRRSGDVVIASANAWSLIRSGDDVRVHFDYGDENDDHEAVPVAAFVAGLTAYREAVVRAIENGNELDSRWWAQKNPPD
jgi:hypothetical protein